MINKYLEFVTVTVSFTSTALMSLVIEKEKEYYSYNDQLQIWVWNLTTWPESYCVNQSEPVSQEDLFCTVAASKLHEAAWRIFGPTGSLTWKRSILNAWGHETLLCAQIQSQEHPLRVCSDWTPHYKVKTKTRESNVSKNTGMPWLYDSTLLTYSCIEVTKNHSLWWVQSEA